MSEFTKGPWKVDEYVDEKAFCVIAPDLNNCFIAEDIRNEANAHLIAASPDMYEALEEFVDCFSDETGASCPSYEGVDNAIKALAKAKGESE